MAKPGYLLIPDGEAARTDLAPSHKLVMAVLARLQGDSASSYPSLEYIATAAGMSRRQVKRIISDLRKRKEITVLFHRHQSSTYSVPWATARALRKKWAEEREQKARKTA